MGKAGICCLNFVQQHIITEKSKLRYEKLWTTSLCYVYFLNDQ